MASSHEETLSKIRQILSTSHGTSKMAYTRASITPFRPETKKKKKTAYKATAASNTEGGIFFGAFSGPAPKSAKLGLTSEDLRVKRQRKTKAKKNQSLHADVKTYHSTPQPRPQSAPSQGSQIATFGSLKIRHAPPHPQILTPTTEMIDHERRMKGEPLPSDHHTQTITVHRMGPYLSEQTQEQLDSQSMQVEMKTGKKHVRPASAYAAGRESRAMMQHEDGKLVKVDGHSLPPRPQSAAFLRPIHEVQRRQPPKQLLAGVSPNTVDHRAALVIQIAFRTFAAKMEAERRNDSRRNLAAVIIQRRWRTVLALKTRLRILKVGKYGIAVKDKFIALLDRSYMKKMAVKCEKQRIKVFEKARQDEIIAEQMRIFKAKKIRQQREQLAAMRQKQEAETKRQSEEGEAQNQPATPLENKESLDSPIS